MSETLESVLNHPFTHLLRKELRELLQPIDAQQPAGVSLRYDPLYDQIREARSADNPTLPQGVWQRDLVHANWALVEQLTTETIAERSKDLQLAVWRTEALLHLHSLPGFTAGCHLIYGLHTEFTTTLHPAPEQTGNETSDLHFPLDLNDAGVENRLNLIQWINEKLALQLKLLPLTEPDELTGVRKFNLSDLESARLLDQSGQQRVSASTRENGLQLFEQSMALTPDAWLLQRWNELQHASQIVFQLDDLFDLVYGKGNGGLLRIKEVFEHMLSNITPVLSEREASMAFHTVSLPSEAPYETASLPAGITAEDSSIFNQSLATPKPFPSKGSAVYGESQGLGTRDEAYRQLVEIANFLSRLEPHSPVPYLLRRAVAWGGMPLEELLPELLSDQAAVRDVGSLLRLKESAR